MSQESASSKRGPGLVPLSLSAIALLAFGAYVWQTLAPKPSDLIIAYPAKSVLFSSHIGQILQRSDILAQNGVTARFEAPDFLNEFSDAALDADVVLTGEAHGLRLDGRRVGARIVATLGSGGRLGLVVPADSEVETIADLRGKRVAATPANALHRWLTEHTRAADLGDEDWELVSYEGLDYASTSNIDAAAQWDPFLFLLERQGESRVLAYGDYFTSVVFSERLVGEDRELGLAVLTAIKQAFHHLNSDPAQAAQWLAGDNGRPPVNMQMACFGINGNFKRRSFRQITLSPELPSFLRALDEDNRFLVEKGFLAAPVDLERLVDGSLVDQVDAQAFPLASVGDAPEE
jgi:ABC-type nitrate/sulfonate/bicarbonate transport system substrate-binding protein